MKIARLDLQAFGPFTNTRLDLSAGKAGLHLIHGPNETGKSSCLRAITALLYGIPGQTDDNFLHPYNKLRIGAELWGAEDQPLAITRRKGNKNSLRDGDDDAPLDEALLRQLLGGIDHDAFVTRFGINHDQLVAGGQAIVDGQGDLGEILFAAGAGLGNLKSIREQLDRESEDLFTPRSRKKSIDEALEAWRVARERVEQAKLRPVEWERHQADLSAANSERDELQTSIAELRRQLDKLQRIEKALPLLPEHRRLEEELQALKAIPRLDDEFTQRRHDAVNRLQIVEKEQQRLLKDRKKCTGELAAIVPAPQWLAFSDEIEQLVDRRVAFQNCQRDLPIEQRNAEAIERDIAQVLAKAGAVAEGKRILLPSADEVRVTKLAQQYQSLRDAVEGSQRRLAASRSSEQSASTALQALPTAIDTGSLERTTRKIDRGGDLEGEIEATERELEKRRDRWMIGCKRLPGYRGPREELISLAVPSRETIDRFAEEAADRDVQRSGLANHLSEQQRAADALQSQLAALTGPIELPTEEQLAQAKRQRDTAWRQLKQDWPLTQSKPSGKQSAKSQPALFDETEGDPIAEYEALVARVDECSFQLRAHAQQIAERAALANQLDAARTKLDSLSAAVEKMEEQQAEAFEQWQQLWQPLQIDPLTPREMRGWRESWETLSHEAQDHRANEQEIVALRNKLTVAQTELAVELTSREMRAEAGESLADLLASAHDLLEQDQATAQQRQRLQDKLHDLTTERDELRQQHEAAVARLEQWRREWREAVQPLGLRDDVSADEASEVLRNFRDAEKLIGREKEVQRRIAEMGAEIENYAAWVNKVVVQLATDLKDKPLEEIVLEFRARLEAAKEADRQQQHWRVEQSRVAEELKTKQAEAEHAQGELQLLCSEAQCESIEQLTVVERSSKQKRELQLQFDGVASQLRQLVGNESIKDFLRQVAEQEPTEIAPRRERLGQKLAEAEQQQKTLDHSIGVEQNWIASHDGSAAAAEAEAEVQNQLAIISRLAGRYARVKLSSVVLNRAVERYREQNQSGVLQRASEFFAQLTLGQFESLRADQDASGRNMLHALRAGDAEPIDVNAMSDGTSDQLYLALRLASLERHYADRGPIPFIVDDILNRYDDDRAVAALKALAELSEKAQVIFFTHHPHLVELAQASLDDDLLFVHDLAAAKQTAGRNTASSASE